MVHDSLTGMCDCQNVPADAGTARDAYTDFVISDTSIVFFFDDDQLFPGSPSFHLPVARAYLGDAVTSGR